MTDLEKIVGKNKYLVLCENNVCLKAKHMKRYLAQTVENKASIDKVLSLATCNVKSVTRDSKTPETLENIMNMYNNAICAYLSNPTTFKMNDYMVRKQIIHHIKEYYPNVKDLIADTSGIKTIHSSFEEDVVTLMNGACFLSYDRDIKAFIKRLRLKESIFKKHDAKYYFKLYTKCLQQGIKEYIKDNEGEV